MADILGKYRIGAKIGGGGMAEVLEGTLIGAEGFSRPVAIKRILPAMSRDPGFAEMFINEARLASLLSHPNIVSVLDFAKDDDDYFYLVMELVRGLDLRQAADSGRLPTSVSCHIACDVLKGLSYAHELVHNGKHLGIVHRDISPHNIMLSWNGAVKVVDFGIAKAIAATGASRSGSLKGKLAYMSPEQAHGKDLDGRSDVFAVGIMLHELLTGQRLFDGQTEPEILARLLTQPIPRPSEIAPDIPPALDQVVMSMLARDRDQRVVSATVAAEQLLNCNAITARGALDLQRVLEERFSESIPPRADASGPVSAPHLQNAGHAQVEQGNDGPGVPAPFQLAAMTLTAPTSQPAATPPHNRKEHSPDVHPSALGATPLQKRLRTLVIATSALAVVLAAIVGVRAMAPDDTALQLSSAKTTEGPPSTTAHPNAKLRQGHQSIEVAATAKIADPPRFIIDAGADGRVPGATPEDRSTAHTKMLATQPAHSGTGKVRVVVTPWARVKVHGQRMRQTPATFVLPTGKHRITIYNDDLGKKVRKTVHIRKGRTTRVNLTW